MSELHDMPHTRASLTTEELLAWEASRDEAARTIDLRNCEMAFWYVQDADPYGIRESLGEEVDDLVGRGYFVRSPESRGWVYWLDLPTTEQRMAVFSQMAIGISISTDEDGTEMDLDLHDEFRLR